MADIIARGMANKNSASLASKVLYYLIPTLVGDAVYTDGSGNYFKDSAKTIPATDNAPAWNSFISTVAEGSAIYIPKGQYFFGAALNTRKGIEIFGVRANDDAKTQLIIKDTATGNGFNLSSTSSGVKIKDLYIKCCNTSLGAVINIAGNASASQYVVFCEFENLWVTGASVGIKAQDCYFQTFKNVVSATNGTGFLFNNLSTTLHMERCWAYQNTGNGYDITGTYYGHLLTCAADKNGGYAYNLTNCEGFGLVNCGAETNTLRAVNINGGEVNCHGFVSVSNGASDTSCSMLYVSNAIVSFTSGHEHTIPAGITCSIYNNTSNLNIDMTNGQQGLQSSLNAYNYGNYYMGPNQARTYGGLNKSFLSTPTAQTYAASSGDTIINPAYNKSTSPVKAWLCTTGGVPGSADFRPLYYPVLNDTTANRPTGLHTTDAGYQYIDTTLGKPIWWNGTAWKDATGATV